MKDIYKFFMAGLFLCAGSLSADYGDNDVLYENPEEPEQEPQTPGQYTLLLKGDYVAKANARHDGGEDFHGNIRYHHEKAQFDAVVYYNKQYEEAVNLSLGYEFTYLNWNKNPFFRRKDYDTLTVAGTYITQRLNCWKWVVQGAVNIDADKWSWMEYTTYDMLLWGRYTWNSCIGLHFGIYGETGIKLDRVWPVLGFDWTLSDRWLLNAIFPLNVSLTYTWNECFSIALAGRFFNERHKAGDNGAYEKAVWRYENSGAELALYNNWFSWLKTNVHAGYTFGGKLKIADRRDNHSRRFRFNSSAYCGAEITANF